MGTAEVPGSLGSVVEGVLQPGGGVAELASPVAIDGHGLCRVVIVGHAHRACTPSLPTEVAMVPETAR